MEFQSQFTVCGYNRENASAKKRAMELKNKKC